MVSEGLNIPPKIIGIRLLRNVAECTDKISSGRNIQWVVTAVVTAGGKAPLNMGASQGWDLRALLPQTSPPSFLTHFLHLFSSRPSQFILTHFGGGLLPAAADLQL